MHTPAPRLWSDSTDSWAPCGGISFNGTRTPFPLCEFIICMCENYVTDIAHHEAGGNFSFVVSRDADRLAFNYATAEGKPN